jgi:hypothetical protein
MRRGNILGFASALMLGTLAVAAAELKPIVEVEEDVYSYSPANNGAGPMWCAGSTCLARVGDDVFASGLETIPDAKPLNNCRWVLFHRTRSGWVRARPDGRGRTREPSPLACFQDGSVFLSANPTLATEAEPNGGPARPEIFQFSAASPTSEPRLIVPAWQGTPRFSEHSYRSFAADGANREMVLFQNIGYAHAEWSFRDRRGSWRAQGQIKWPWGADYDKAQPIRICYPNVALQDRAVHFFGVSDIVEPYKKWREYKKQLTGNEWDYDFRRLFYTWTDDITQEPFRDWMEIASRDKTCGSVWPCDLWLAEDKSVHLLWTERAIDERLREKFFPEAKQSHSLVYAVVRNGKVISRRTLIESSEDRPGLVASAGRFQVAPGNRLFAAFYVSGKDPAGKSVSENRVLEIRRDGSVTSPVRVPLVKPFTSYFTATVRAGSPPSATLDMLGQREGSPGVISYARVRLF